MKILCNTSNLIVLCCDPGSISAAKSLVCDDVLLGYTEDIRYVITYTYKMIHF